MALGKLVRVAGQFVLDTIVQVKEKIFILNKKVCTCSSKKFSNKRANFSQVTPYPSPTTSQLFLLHSHDEI